MVSQIQGFRLSPQQSHLWKLQQESHVYQVQCAMLIAGDLKRAVLEEALQDVINRHEILRTTFHRRPGITVPMQVVGNSTLPDLPFTDLSELSESAQAAWVEQRFKEQRDVPFDYANGPLVRLALLAVSKHRHLLLINLPSLCADASSLKILVHEISRCYGCALVGEELTDEALQYADLAEWQNELFESKEGAAGIDYWRRQGFSELLATRLPFEKTSNSEAKFEPRFITLPLHPDLRARIKSLVGKYETSFSTFMLACWQILLWRLNGRSDNVIGTSFECRKYEELADVPGLFAKYLPLRCRLEDALQFEQVLKQTDEQRSEIERWQEWFSWSQTRETLFTPLCFDFREWSVKYSSGEVSFSIDKQYVCSDRYIVKLSCDEKDDCLTTQINYDANVCRDEDMTLLAMQFETLLEKVVAAPEAAIARLEILTNAEREKLVVDFNRTAAEFPRDLCVHQLFEEQAARSKDEPALIYKDSFLSYSELDRRANQLARYLVSLGVGPDRLVGIYLERSPEMVVALLATLKAGGAYLPLDPGHPPERLAYILEDARVSVLLTTLELRERLHVEVAQVVCLDADWNILAHESDAPLPSEVQPDHLAYVIYTSGSTGRPKGVMIEHRSVVNFLTAMRREPGFAEWDTLLAVTTLSFDIAGLELYLPLTVGGCVAVAGREVVANGVRLRELLVNLGPTVMQATPATWWMLLEAGWEGDPRLKVLCGGEALPRQLADQLLERAGEVWNMYGPTETTIWSACTRVVSSNREVSVGRPIANTQLYLLDEMGDPVPVGKAGELYIGGDGLARGYLNRPDLTAERFVPDPFGSEPGGRLYRTGDLGRYLADGQVEYVGRLDYQVKVRGYRIELGEIEAVIVEQQGVRDAVVIAREDDAGEKVLLAYVVLRQDAERGVEELKGELRAHLPEYMIPVALILMEAFPLTPNGKIDRKALPAYQAEQLAAVASEQASRTPIEEIVAGAWAEVLGLKNVGVSANFFELGGHSLLALRMVSRLQSAFQIELPVDSVFEAPTVSSLAAFIENIISAGEGHARRVIQRVSRDEDLPLSFGQQRLWIQDQFNPGTAEYNIPLAVRLDGKFDVDAFEQMLGEVIRRHEVLRTSFPRSGDFPVQAIAPAKTVSVPVVNLCQLPEASRESEALRLAAEEAALPFDLAGGPLLRVRILRLDEEQHYVLFTMHHIISDGWSMGVLVREIAILYDAFTTGKAAPLPELPVQYADFAFWQRQWLKGGVEESQLAYWKHQLAGSQPVLQLRTDRPRPAMRASQGATQLLVLSRALSEGVKQLSRREGVTQFMTLLATFQILLRHYTQEDDMLIGTDVANRTCREVEGLIGFFVNQLVFRTNLSGDPNFKDLLGRVRTTALGAYTNQDLPFEKLVEVIKPKRSSNYSPLFQVKFIFQNALEETLEIPGGVLTPLNVNQATTKLDLVMSIEDNGHALDISLLYATDLFNETTITQMLKQFEVLLGLITTQPEVKLSGLDEALDEFNRQQQRAKEEQFREARRSLFKNIKHRAGNGNGRRNEPEQTTPEVNNQTSSDHLMMMN